MLGPGGASAPRRAAIVVPPQSATGRSRCIVAASSAIIAPATRSGATALEPEDYGQALNRDVLIPRPAGRFLFGRLIDRDEEKLQILPLEAGGRQQVVANPPWLAVATKLVRKSLEQGVQCLEWVESGRAAAYVWSVAGGRAAPKGVPEAKADRAQGLGHRLRKSQAQSLPRHTQVMAVVGGKRTSAYSSGETFPTHRCGFSGIDMSTPASRKNGSRLSGVSP